LADDAPAYAAAIRAAGGRARAVDGAGLVHGYLRARATVPRAAASFARIVDPHFAPLPKAAGPWRTLMKHANLTHWAERVDMAAAFRWTVR
jgi:hypothetical protein